MANEPVKGVSLNPDDFVQGGLVDDVDAVLKSARFVRWDYQGQADPVLAIHLNFLTSAGEEYDQYYSAGDLKLYAPSDDGKAAVPVAGTGHLKISSNAGQFLTSLVNSGFPKNRLDSGDISVIDGTGAHLRRIAQIERKGLKKSEKEGDREKTLLAVEKVLFLPGEKPTFEVGVGTNSTKGQPGANKSVGAPVGASAPAPAAAAPSGAVDDKAVNYVMQVLAENGGSFQKAGLPSALFKILTAAKDPDQPKILTTTFDPAWIANPARPWKVGADGVISL